MDDYRLDIGSRLKQIRNSRNAGQGISITKFASVVGETPFNLSNYEQGKANVPPRVLIALFRLGYDPVWILTGESEMIYRRDSIASADSSIATTDFHRIIKEFDVAAGRLKDAISNKSMD